jgi:hypothetical protein
MSSGSSVKVYLAQQFQPILTVKANLPQLELSLAQLSPSLFLLLPFLKTLKMDPFSLI